MHELEGSAVEVEMKVTGGGSERVVKVNDDVFGVDEPDETCVFFGTVGEVCGDLFVGEEF